MTAPSIRISRRFETWLAVFTALLLNLIFFHDLLKSMPFFRDLFHEFYPLKVFLAEQLRQGRIPLWNPALFLGMPFVGELATACFYPLNLLFLFLAPVEGLRYYLLFHYPFAAVGLYLFLRDLDLRPAAAAQSAMTFSWSGYLVAQHGNLVYLISPCYFPWALLCFHRLVRSSGWGWVVAAGCSVALPFLAGEPQGAALCGLLGFSYALFAAPEQKKKFTAATILLPLLSLLLAAGISMIQFLPAWELGRFSERASGFPFERVTYWSFDPIRFLEFLWPNLWGLPWPKDRFWGGFLTNWSTALPWSMGVYLGLWSGLASVLALRPGLPTNRGRIHFFAGLSLLALLLALGRFTPFFSLVYYLVPGARLFRYPEKYLALLSLGIAVLAGFGTHRFLETRTPSRRFFSGARILFGSLLLPAILGWLGRSWVEAGLARFFLWEGASHLDPAASASVLLLALTRTALVALGLALILEFCRHFPQARKTLPVLLLSLTGLDLWTANRPLVDTAPDWIYSSLPHAAHSILQAEKGSGEKFRFFRDQSLKDYRGPFPPGPLPAHLKTRFWEKDTLRSNWSQAFGLEEITGYSQATPERFYRLWGEGLHLNLLQAFNVKYVLLTRSWSALDTYSQAPTLESDPVNNFRIMTLEGYFPRAYLVPQARAVRTEEQALAEVKIRDLSREVVLMTSDPLPAQAEAGPSLPAQVLDYQPDQVELQIQTEHPGWLVLSDSFFPGWQAEVNGKPVKIYRANYLVRAVAVGPGRNLVKFVYRPASYLWGRAITLAFLGLVLLGFPLFGMIWKKKA